MSAEQCQTVGASMNLQKACPSPGDKSCQVSCQDPSTSNQCIVLQSQLVDGSPCGYGGTCNKGNCQAGSALDTAKVGRFLRPKHSLAQRKLRRRGTHKTCRYLSPSRSLWAWWYCSSYGLSSAVRSQASCLSFLDLTRVFTAIIRCNRRKRNLPYGVRGKQGQQRLQSWPNNNMVAVPPMAQAPRNGPYPPMYGPK